MFDTTERDAMLTAITEAWSAATTPDDMRERLLAWSKENAEHTGRLRAIVGATLAWWIIKGAEAGHDRDVLDQVALQQTQLVCAMIARAMKQRQGLPYSPARVAIVAYHAARLAEAGDGVDIEGLTETAEAIINDVEAENERLRELVDEIADMDPSEPEIHYRDIIARCRGVRRRGHDAEGVGFDGESA